MDAGNSYSDLHEDKCNQLKIRTRSSSRLQQKDSNNKIDSNNDSSIDESDKDPKKDVEICMGTLNSSKTLKDYVSKEETDRFPTGWIYKSDRSKFEKMYEGDKSTDHVGKLVLIPPDFWGWFDTKKKCTEYWKVETYHESLHDMTRDQMKNDILLVGKIIRKEEKQKQKQKQYIVLLLCDSNVNVECSFKESQIEEYLMCKKNEHKANLNMINNNVRDVDQSDNYSTDQGSDHSFVKTNTIRDDAIHNEAEDDSDSYSDEDSEYESDVNVIQPETISESSDSSFSEYSQKKSKKPIAKKLPKKTTKTAKKIHRQKQNVLHAHQRKKTQKKPLLLILS